ncbi:MAG: hypothetical protein PUG64_04165 [Bacteroidales bacterium]|nr:hypothetical protein [Bacteroidales bacterium]
MANIKEGFSLFDFCKRRADKIRIYGEETLDDEGNIIPFIEQAALITHYLQLRDSNVDIPYAAQAEGILNLWYEFVKGEKQKKLKMLALLKKIQQPFKDFCFRICSKPHLRLHCILSLHLLICSQV